MSDRILLVDDDVLSRLQLRELLQSVGYVVIEAGNGIQALQLFEQSSPDMVLLDAMMPEMDGIECCRRLRELEHGNGLPILIVTALYDGESIEQAFLAGATDYITKPIQWLVLRQRVQRLLDGNRLMKELQTQSHQMQQRENHLRMVLDAARMGTWELKLVGAQLLDCPMTLSDNLLALLANGESASGSRNTSTKNPSTIINSQTPRIGTLADFLTYVHPPDRDLLENAIAQTINSCNEFESEFRLTAPSGNIHWIYAKGLLIRDLDGNGVRLSGVDIDITRRKQEEERLRLSEERLQIVARATNDAVWDWDLTTDRVWWNESIEFLFGYVYSQINPNCVRQWWSERIHPEDRQRVSNEIIYAIDSRENLWLSEYRFLRDDGEYADIFERGYIVRDRDNRPVRMIGSMMDITNRKQVQTELLRQNLRSQLFADVSLKIRQSLQIDTILQTSVTEVQKLLQADRVLIIRFRSNGLLHVFKEAVVDGYTAVIDQDLVDPCFGEEYINRYRQGYITRNNDIYNSGIEPCYIEFLEQFQVRANLVVPIFIHNQVWGILVAHQCNAPRTWSDWESELLLQLSDQIGIALTQAKLLEQETQQREELARSNEELQNFAFVASHDLQEPLRKIKAFGDRLRISTQGSLDEQSLDYLARMQNATGRMQALIEDLLSLSRVTTRAQPFVETDLNQIVQEVISDLEVQIQQTNGIVEVESLPIISADPLQIRQLLQNLIGNALKFHRPQVPPHVKISCLPPIQTEPQLDTFTTTPTNPHFPIQPIRQQNQIEQYEIIVTDNGIGFEQKYTDRIFNIFQRLHGRSEYEGTGIGLAICRKIVERHHGKISATSKPNQGATFTITLPRHPPN